MPGRRRGWTRHSLHIFTYSFVSASLILMGLVFSGFAVFDKNSLIGQIWLAGPTTIAVGLVLCGKVIIDCRPARLDEEEDCDSFLDPEIAIVPPLPVLPPTANHLSPKEQEVVKSIDAEYQKKKDAGQIVSIKMRHSEKDSEAGSDTTVSEIWNRRVLDAGELLDGRLIEAPLVEGPTPPPTPSTPPPLSSLHSSPSTSPLPPRRSRSHRERGERERSQPRRPSSSVLYQGETFVLHEMQFLI